MIRRLINRIRQSLSLKLSLMILVISIVVFGMTLTILFSLSRQDVREESMAHAKRLLDNTALRVKYLLLEVETATRNAEWRVLRESSPDRILNFSRQVVDLYPDINGCTISMEPGFFPQYGRYFSAYSLRLGDTISTVREAEYEYFDEIWYKTPLKSGRSVWLDPFDDFGPEMLSTSEIIASYCRPLMLRNGQIVGVISTDLSLSSLSRVINAEKPYPHSYYVMLGGDGRYYVHPDSTRLFKTMGSDDDRQTELSELSRKMLSRKKGMMQMDIDGNPSVVFYQPLDNTKWSIAIVCRMDDVFENYSRLTYVLIPLLIVGLLLLFIICFFTVSHLIRPLRLMDEQARYIAAGNFDQEIVCGQTYGVIGRLQINFLSMQHSLKSYTSQANQVNEDLKQRHEELIKASQLVEESRLRKEAFIQNMTHQIRTPLNIVYGFAQVLCENMFEMSEEEKSNLIKTIAHNTVTITRMIHMLIDSSEIGKNISYKRDDYLSCNKLAREVADDVMKQYSDRIRVVLDTEVPDSLCIHTNHLYFFRTLRELFYNSAKYANKGDVFLRVRESETVVKFIVEDVGPGIAEENRNLMFERFLKIDDFSEGLGLGLPLTKQHAVNLGGDLFLDTSYTDGCRFIVELPKDDAA